MTYVIECFYPFTLIINDMKRLYKRVFKSKKPSVGSIHGPGPASFASTSTGTTDPMPSLLACDTESDGTPSAQVTASVSVIQFRPSHL